MKFKIQKFYKNLSIEKMNIFRWCKIKFFFFNFQMVKKIARILYFSEMEVEKYVF